MSFTRRVKYGNKVALRKLKRNISSEKLDTVGFLFVCIVAMFAMNIALVSMG
jgi:hypothetical protein